MAVEQPDTRAVRKVRPHPQVWAAALAACRDGEVLVTLSETEVWTWRARR